MKSLNSSLLLSALDVVLVFRQSDNRYRVFGSPPDWFAEFNSLLRSDENLSKNEELSPYFVEFLDELEAFWKTEGTLPFKKKRSEWWSKFDGKDKTHHFRATAVSFEYHKILLIEHATSDDEIFRSLQKYKEHMINLEQLEQAQLECKTELVKYNELVLTDDLTGLPNQTGFFSLAKEKIEEINQSGKYALVIAVTMDGLHLVNHKYGTIEGSLALLATVNILNKIFPKSDIVARFGGSEFFILAEETPINKEDAITGRIKNAVEQYNQTSPRTYDLSLSIGVVRVKNLGKSILEETVKIAGSKMNKEKLSKNYTLK